MADEGATSGTQRLTAIPSPSLVELVDRASAGDSGAWDELVDRFSGMVWAVARGHGLSSADAADVSQTTWLRLVEHLDRIREPDRVGAWLATTARHESMRVAKSASRTVLTSDDTVIDLRAVDVEDELPFLTSERDAQLWAFFRRLPTRCQVLLRLLVADEPLSYRDLGEALEMPVGSIGPTRARCLEHLRRLADEAGISLAGEMD
jgi:RNA polymerase sigma factor (sigma-70 family)